MKQDLNNDNSPLRPERLMKAINANLKDDAIISADVGTSTVWSTRYLNLSVNNKFIISSWLGTMAVVYQVLWQQNCLSKPSSSSYHRRRCVPNGNARLCYSCSI